MEICNSLTILTFKHNLMSLFFKKKIENAIIYTDHSVIEFVILRF